MAIVIASSKQYRTKGFWFRFRNVIGLGLWVLLTRQFPKPVNKILSCFLTQTFKPFLKICLGFVTLGW